MTLFARRFGCCCRARFTLLSAVFTTRLRLRTWFTLATCPLFRLACCGSGFAFFGLLRFALRLDAGFCFFKLLTGMSDGGTFTYVSGLDEASPFTHLAPVAAADAADAVRAGTVDLALLRGRSSYPMPVQYADIALRRHLDATGIGLVDTGHPLLTAQVQLAGSGERMFTGRISTTTHPWRADHAVLDLDG